jgi:hypothetical protein
MSADSYRELAKRGPWDLVRRAPMILRETRPGQFAAFHAASGAVPRLNEVYTPKPYVYRGTGSDVLTAWMDDEPDEQLRLTRRQERMEMLAELRLHDGFEPEPPPGCVTAEQAAELLGVNVRTIERYKRDLRRSA